MRVALSILLLASLPVSAANWPAWRGPDGSGVTSETNLPLRWSARENVRWRVPLPDRGNSTPIAWGDRVFLNQALTEKSRRTVLCLERDTGQVRWQAGIDWKEPERTHEDNPPCSPSPVTDGERVIAWFGSAGIFCWDWEGRELWRRDLGRQDHQWGYAASPVLHGNLCYLNFGPGPRSFLIALDKRTGETVWQYDLPALEAGSNWEDFGGPAEHGRRPGAPKISELAGSWATPLVVRTGRQDELVVAFPLQCQAFAPQTGDLLWTCAGPNIGAYSSPFFGEGLVVVNGSGFRNTLVAVRPGGRGDVTRTQRAWFLEPGFSKTCLGGGVIYGKHIYQANMMGMAECRDLGDGHLVWEERLVGTGARHASWSSPVLSGDRIYVANQNADVFVLRASPNFQCLATNSIGGEPMNASLAVCDGAILLRTDKSLWCIAQEPETTAPRASAP